MVVEEAVVMVVAGEEVEVAGALEVEVMVVAGSTVVEVGITMVAVEDLVVATGDGVVGRAAVRVAAVAVAAGSTAGRRSGATRAGAGGGAPGARETVLVPLSPFLMNWKFLINIKSFNYLYP